MPRWTESDRRFMAMAMSLAERGQGFVEPNPMVGCVIVRNGRVVGQGWHERFGGLHAEPNALAVAGRRAVGATVYVTLEPCNHVGKTPPCTEALIAARVGRVVAAMRDPNPLVAGRGFQRLRRAGIPVEVGLMRDEATALNAPFITFHKKNRPYVILKWAQSLDGKIATRTGDSRWISSIESRRVAHALRARVDAVLVGVNTVRTDDPELSARHVRAKRIATRIVLDADLRTPLKAKLVRTACQVPTMIVAVGSRRARSSDVGFERRRKALESAGCEVLLVGRAGGETSLPDLLRALRERGMTNVLVEGGGRVLGTFVEQGLADEAVVFVAPKLIGGDRAPGPLGGVGPARLKSSPPCCLVACSQSGPDFCYNIRLGIP